MADTDFNPIDFNAPSDDDIETLKATVSGAADDDAASVVEDTEEEEFSSFLQMIKEDGSDSFAQPKDAAPTETDEDTEEDDDDESDEGSEESGSGKVEKDADEVDEDADEEEEFEDESSEVDFDTVITLPNGQELSIEDLHTGYRDGSELQAERKKFEEEREAFESSSTDLSEKLDLAKLEADRVLDDFKDFDWAALAVEDPKEFANTKLFVEKYAQRSKDIRNAQQTIKDDVDREKAETTAATARSAVAQLEKDIPDWNRELYSKVMEHAVQLGMSEEKALGLVDVGVIKALVNSLNVTEGKRAVKAKITKKRPVSAKVIKSGGKKPAKKVTAKTSFTNESEEFDFFRSILK